MRIIQVAIMAFLLSKASPHWIWWALLGVWALFALVVDIAEVIKANSTP